MNGILSNYNSFNYSIDNQNQLILNNDIITSYQEQNIEEYRNKIQIKKIKQHNNILTVIMFLKHYKKP